MTGETRDLRLLSRRDSGHCRSLIDDSSSDCDAVMTPASSSLHELLSHQSQNQKRSLLVITMRSGATNSSRMAGLASVLLLAFAGCTGDNGRPGLQGPQGPAGDPGEVGQDGNPGELDPALSTWEKALAGIGGEEALSALAGFQVEASVVRSLGGEGYSATDPVATLDLSSTTVSWDTAGDALRVDWDRNSLFTGAMLTYSEITNMDVGYVEGDDSVFGPDASTTDMPSGRWAAVRKQTMMLHPHVLLQAIMDDPSIATEGGAALHNGAIHEQLIVQDSVADITLWINASTGRLSKLTTMENDHLHRDVLLDVHYHDWMNDADGGAAFPLSVFIVVDDQIIHEDYRTSVTLNPNFGATMFDVPPGAPYDDAAAAWGRASHQWLQGFTSLGIPLDIEQTFVDPIELQPGVYHLRGGSHNSMAIEQENGVIILEAPLYPERSEAILAWVATQFPGKAVTHVVLTHHHHDHSAGARAFVAAGATIVIGDASIEFFRDIFRAPSTIVEDNLQTNPAQANFMAVAPEDLIITLSDGTNPIDIYPFSTGHADDMVMIHMPNGDYLFQSDLFNPDDADGGALLPQFAIDFYDAIVDTGIANPGLTLVGGHGTTAPLAQLEAFLNIP